MPVRPVALLMAVVVLAACQQVSSVRGQPERMFTLQDQRDLIESIVNEEESTDVNQPPEIRRNEVITARMLAIDLYYTEFESDLFREGRAVDFGLTLGQIVAGTAGALVSPASTTQALSGISAGLAGVGEAFDQQLLADLTMQAIVTQMRADRTAVRGNILTKLTQSVVEYPLPLALSDLESYYRAGTLVSALTSINESAGVQLQEAEQESQTVISLVRVVPADQTTPETTTLEAQVLQRIRSLTDEMKTELARNPPNLGSSPDRDPALVAANANWERDASQAERLSVQRVNFLGLSAGQLQVWLNRIGELENQGG